MLVGQQNKINGLNYEKKRERRKSMDIPGIHSTQSFQDSVKSKRENITKSDKDITIIYIQGKGIQKTESLE